MKQNQPTFDVKAFANLLLRRWYIFVLAAVIGAVIGNMVFHHVVSAEVSATIKLDAPNDMLGLPTGRIDRNRFRDNENAILASHDLHVRCVRKMLAEETYPFAMPPKTEESVITLANHLDRDYQYETPKDYAATITIRTHTKSPKEEMVIMDQLIQTYMDTTINRAKEMLLQNNVVLDKQMEYIEQMHSGKLRDSLIDDILYQKECNTIILSNASNTISYIAHPHVTTQSVTAPYKRILILAVLMMCLVMGVYLLYVLMTSCVMSVDQLEEYINRSILSAMPRKPRCKCLCKCGGKALSTKSAARFLCEYTLSKYPDSKVLMVASYRTGEGKTFVASNMALALVGMGKKVAYFSLSRAGKPMTIPGVEVVSSLDSGPLQHDTLSQSLSKLRKEYDYVLVDTSALRDQAEMLWLKDLVDLTLLIVRPWKTSLGDLVELQRMPFVNVEYVVNAI